MNEISNNGYDEVKKNETESSENRYLENEQSDIKVSEKDISDEDYDRLINEYEGKNPESGKKKIGEDDISDKDIEKLQDSVKEKETETNIEKDNPHLPRNDGKWEDENKRGECKWIPDDEVIPKKSNPDESTWKELKEKYNTDGIEYRNGEPDFSTISKGEVKVSEFTEDRNKNFTRADEEMARIRGCSPEEVKAWREDPSHRYTWHECRDCETMQKVPSEVHNNVVHSGGISEKKQETRSINTEDWLDE